MTPLEYHGAVAQLGARLTGSQEVGGSNPPSSTTKTTEAMKMVSVFFFSRLTHLALEAPPSIPSTFTTEGTDSITIETVTIRREADGCVGAADLMRQRARRVLPRADGAPLTKG